MTTIQQIEVGQTFTIPADADGITYEKRTDGIYAIDNHSNVSERIDEAQFADVNLRVIARQQ